MEEKRKRYEESREELCEITFTHSVEAYDPERVMEIVAEMEDILPTPEGECEISKSEYLSILEEIFVQEIEEDEELIRDSDNGYVIVEYDK